MVKKIMWGTATKVEVALYGLSLCAFCLRHIFFPSATFYMCVFRPLLQSAVMSPDYSVLMYSYSQEATALWS